ncbi:MULTISPECIES: polysaccharide deacetylase family protein [unclassified Haladaptatus]|uniref:polysaccharide deacetylase family protein n=1 Tax=unclassified Haladaptatus TaxID=2622732 RepID=UPI00209C3E31|nr:MULTISPECIES: polysaccharide deacetylase family protein [unclassified Haladaptatus]MCO8247035.1 polysaccharide deacetylase family protein [Haladaptatus sp. AB643]MCO8254581.1 polysaccharide deacetylase family protein [Haladaptatus sp. AB618]
MTRQTRRTFLATAGAIGLAGCSSIVDKSQLPMNGTGRNSRPKAATGPPVPAASDFEKLSGWQAVSGQGTLSKSTDDPYRGSQCAHMVGSDATKAGCISRTLSGTDLRGTNFSMAVKVENYDFAKILIELVAPDGDNAVQLKRTLVGPSDRWVRVNFGVTGVAGTPDLSSVSELRIVGRPVDTNARDPIELFVDDLRTASRPDKGAVMFTFDDSHATHYRAFEILQKYDFAGVEAVIPESIGHDGRLTTDQLSEMADGGWDMAAHPDVQAHSFPEYSPDDQAALLKRTQEYLQSHGFDDGARHLLVPKNQVGPNTFDLARKYYDSIYSFGGCPNAMPFENGDAIVSRVNGKDLDVTKRYVDYAAEYGQLVVPLFHAIGDGGEISESDLESLAQYVQGKDVDVITASDLLDG